MQIFCSDINSWDNFYGLEYLNHEREKKFQRYMQHKDKLRCLIGGLLVQYALGHNKEPIYNEYGKPYFTSGPYFNLSHAGDYVALAVSKHNVGIDIEHIKPYKIDVAKKCFTKNEVRWLQENNCAETFFKMWCAKEAIMKATGQGFSLNPQSFEVLPLVDGLHIVNSENYYLYWYHYNKHILCISNQIAQTKPEVIFVNHEHLLRKLAIIHS